MATAIVLVYMSYLSMSEGYTLAWPVIIGMLATVVLLMYGSTELNTIVRSWRGKYPQSGKRRRNDE